MSYLLDTNVLSETWKKQANKGVLDWIRSIPPEKLFLSVITIGEIRRGVHMLKPSKKRDQLAIWLDEHLPAYFGPNILPIDTAVADRWGLMTAQAKRTLPVIDGLLAATALVHNLKMVTRNEKDFEIPGLEVLNPF
jgi:predicted nucleic acid-binding protein